MHQSLPVCCALQAFQLLQRQLGCLECPDALMIGAVAVAMHALGDVDLSAVDARLQGYADAVRSRVRRQLPQAVVAHLHDVLFEEEGFAGNTDDYYDAANNFLPTVLESKRGLPIILSLIYKDVAGRLGLRVHGVNLPGHFLVSVECGGSPLMIDAFAGGRVIHVEEARELLRRALGEQVEWSEELLRPACHRLWLTRILQNLLNIYSTRGQYRQVAAMLEMQMLLWTDETQLQRDLALVLARCGLSQPARQWLDSYLKANPDDPQNRDLRQLLEVLAG